ncbi:MAG: hypothetical protein Q9190_007391 [Brigantiaea leucoxantha]
MSSDSPSHEQLQFLPGQWLDVHIHGLQQAGGFTITSAPKEAQPGTGSETGSRDGYLELAVQKSPRNPPAAWLWRPETEILGCDLHVRVGGSFVWPPPGLDPTSITRAVFVAGGVGINPLVSISSHLHQNPELRPSVLNFLYTTRHPSSKDLSSVLFFSRLNSQFDGGSSPSRTLQLFLTRLPDNTKDRLLHSADDANPFSGGINFRRISSQDLLAALGPQSERRGVVAYVCGVPAMTDEFVDVLRSAEGMDVERVLCEKWW